jgi:serine/threonine protein kinase
MPEEPDEATPPSPPPKSGTSDEADRAKEESGQTLRSPLPPPQPEETLHTPLGGKAASEADPGERLTLESASRYRLDREFGRGGQSVIMLAYDEHIGREVAFKQLLPERRAESASSTLGNRFLREARVTAQLEHPSIVPVHEVGRRADGSLYYTQKLVRGRTLRAALEACGSLEDRLRLLPNLLAVCQATAYAHGRGVIHRDLKPENVMVGEFGETVVLDWGLARSRKELTPDAPAPERPVQSLLELNVERTQTGTLLGTPAYMSPEQAVGDIAGVDERSDVWSLGVMLFEMIAGRRPFEGATASEVLRQVATGSIPRLRDLSPNAPAELRAIAEHALERDPSHRYRDAGALAAELSAWFSGGRISAYDYSAWELLRRFVARNRALSTIAATALVLISAGIVVGSERERRAVRAHLHEMYERDAQVLANEVNRTLVDKLDSLTLAASTLRLGELDPEARQQALLLIYRETRSADVVGLFDAQSAPLGEFVRFDHLEGELANEHEVVNDTALAAYTGHVPLAGALQAGLAIGHVYMLPDAQGKPVPRLVLAVAMTNVPQQAVAQFREDGWVLAVEVSLRRVAEGFERLRRGETGAAFLLDREGRVIVHPDLDLMFKQTNLAGQPTMRGVQRDEWLGASETVPLLGWKVVVQQSAHEALGTLRHLELYAVILVAMGVLVAVLIGAALACTRQPQRLPGAAP